MGKDWIERKKEEAAGGECNDNDGGSGEGGEEDFRKFVMGLERSGWITRVFSWMKR